MIWGILVTVCIHMIPHHGLLAGIFYVFHIHFDWVQILTADTMAV